LPNFIGQRLEIGDRVSVPGVGEMLIQKLLGSGVKGIVYQAQSNEGKVYALKLSKKLSSDNLDSLKKELINYEIIKETLFLQPQMHVIGNGYVVKELIKGKTLGDYLRSLPQEKVLEDKAVRQFQEMVAFAAKKAVFIADIKPDNIMINKHGDIVVVDSGRKTKVFDSSEEALRNYQEETRKKWKRFLPESIVDVIFENISAMTDKEFERIAKESSQKTFKTPAQIQRPVDISRIIRNSGFDRYSVEQLLNYGLELGESISTMNVKALGNDRFVSENIYRSSAGTSNLNITFSSKPSASCNAAFAKILEAALGK
jgi:serine/threonine protein kinase